MDWGYQLGLLEGRPSCVPRGGTYAPTGTEGALPFVLAVMVQTGGLSRAPTDANTAVRV